MILIDISWYGLVSIDINSGSSIRQKNVESTALDTNLEAAEDIEILRFLEFNKKIKMFETIKSSLAVDVFSDVEKVIIDESGGGQGVVPYLPLNDLRRENK